MSIKILKFRQAAIVDLTLYAHDPSSTIDCLNSFLHRRDINSTADYDGDQLRM